MMGHDFSRQITGKCGTKYGNGNYILGHPKWKWKLYFGTEGVLVFDSLTFKSYIYYYNYYFDRIKSYI